MSSLQQRKREATAEYLVQAALQGLLDYGLDVTVDQIASLAGVSRRTVFNHFDGRDELLSAAALQGQAEFLRSVSEHPGDGDWRGWLTELCRAVHRANASSGRALRELLVQEDLPGPIAAAMKKINRNRRVHYAAIANSLWQAMGHASTAPKAFRGTVIAHLSPFFTMAVTRDAGADHALAATLAENAILAAAGTTAPRRSTDAR
jgi:AcrR family transcriptional regulator